MQVAGEEEALKWDRAWNAGETSKGEKLEEDPALS